MSNARVFLQRVLGAVVLLWPFVAMAQTPPPPPEKPFIKPLPAATAWTRTLGGKSVQEKAEEPETAPRMVQASFSTYDGVTREVQQWSNGRTTERWSLPEYLLFQQLHTPGVAILRNRTEARQTAFAELAWITEANYQSVRSFEKRPCYVFRRSVAAPALPASIRVAASASEEEAWIDVETGRPLVWKSGDAVWLYAYPAAPSQALTLPPEFEKALERYRKALAEPEKHRMKF